MRRRKYLTKETTIEGAVSEAYSEFQSLSEELNEWADNIQEKFAEKADRVREAADPLSNLEEPEIPDSLKAVKIDVTEVQPRSRRKPLSRADRCSNAAGMLRSVIDYIEGREDVADEEGDNSEEEQLIEDFRSTLDEAVQEAESVEFPGMFG